MNPLPAIEAKRDGQALDPSQLEALLEAYLAGEVEEYQMAAFLMAVQIRGLDGDELAVLLDCMLRSGVVLDRRASARPRVDKHSTGGVGDKVSLPLVPLVAEAGLHVPMMCGRGLGHTGGTLDKLESIPGFRTDLSVAAFSEAVEAEGGALIGQTPEIAPLDRCLYALRSVTGTVPSIPLIAASIMSKKLAEGLVGLVLDVKVGAGAFLPEEERALALARTMVELGRGRDVRTVALLTAMDRPLGRSAGNALEVTEALACLRGEGPADVREIVVALAGEMLALGGASSDARTGRERAQELLDGGRPLERFRRIIARQGGDPRVVDDPALLPSAPVVLEVRWEGDGAGAPEAVRGVDPRRIGLAVVELGGGRTRLGQEIHPGVGFDRLVAPGDPLEEGALLGRVHARSPEEARRAAGRLREAVTVGAPPAPLRPLVSHRVTADGVAPWSG